MICKYCGGEYANWVQKCPYCGNVNEAADEKEYLKHLEEVRLRLDQVDEEADDIYHKHVGSSMTKLGKILALFLGIALLISGGFFLVTRIQDQQYEKNALAQAQFEQEVFPQLDEWYENGEYEKIFEFNRQLSDENSKYHIYSWEHSTFLFSYYALNEGITEARILLNSGDQPSLSSPIMYALMLLYEQDESVLQDDLESYQLTKQYGITEEEYRIITTEFKPNAYEFLYDDLQLNEDEVKQFYQDNAGNGFIEYVKVQKYAQEIEKEIYH